MSNFRTEYSQTKEAYDRIASSYARKWFFSKALENSLSEFCLQIPSPGRLLDVGCGVGRDVDLLTSAGFDVLGTDVSAGMLKQARALVPKGYFRKLDLLSLGLPSEFYSGIWCSAVLHHLDYEDQLRALAEFQNLLHAGGVLFVSVNQGVEASTDSFGRRKFPLTLEGLRSGVEQVGLEVIQLHSSESSEHDTVESHRWLQVLARRTRTSAQWKRKSLCFFCEPFFFPTNCNLGLPVAASVIFSNSSIMCAIDVAPITAGHCLLISRGHITGFELSEASQLLDLEHGMSTVAKMFRSAFSSEVLFLEHGSNGATEGSCIDHAHVHCVPAEQGDFEKVIEELRASGAVEVSMEQISKGDAAQYISLRGVGTAPRFFTRSSGSHSQLVRQLIASISGEAKYRWVDTVHSSQNPSRFDASVRKLSDAYDSVVGA